MADKDNVADKDNAPDFGSLISELNEVNKSSEESKELNLQILEEQRKTTYQLMSSEDQFSTDQSEAEVANFEFDKKRTEESNRQLAALESANQKSPTYFQKLTKFFKKDADNSGAADEEDEDKKGKKDKKTTSILGKIAGGIGGLAKSTKDSIKSGLPSWKSLVMGGLAAAALVFLNHPKFKEFIDVIKKKIIPALTTLIDDYIIPIGKILWDNIVKQFGFLMTLFDGIGESIKLFKEGKWWEGIKKLFSSIGGWLADAIDSATTALFNIIATFVTELILPIKIGSLASI